VVHCAVATAWLSVPVKVTVKPGHWAVAERVEGAVITRTGKLVSTVVPQAVASVELAVTNWLKSDSVGTGRASVRYWRATRRIVRKS